MRLSGPLISDLKLRIQIADSNCRFFKISASKTIFSAVFGPKLAQASPADRPDSNQNGSESELRARIRTSGRTILNRCAFIGENFDKKIKQNIHVSQLTVAANMRDISQAPGVVAEDRRQPFGWSLSEQIPRADIEQWSLSAASFANRNASPHLGGNKSY